MKRSCTWQTLLILLLMLTLVFTAAVPAALAADRDIDVRLYGRSISFDVNPLLEDGRVLVPFRFIAQAMGIEVHWNPDTRTVEALHGDTLVLIPVGSTQATVSGEPVSLDVPARITGGRTLIPLRFFSEAFGADVHWDGPSSTVTIGFDPPDWPAVKEGTIDIEGMTEPVTLTLLETGRFVTYIPDDMVPTTTANDTWIYAAFGGNVNENAYLRVSFFPDLQQVPSPADLAVLLDLDGFNLVETNPAEHRQIWSVTEFTAVNHPSYSLSGYVGMHAGEPFVVLAHYPWEFGDGFAPRTSLILDHFFWVDSNSYLIP